jgi:hypothetical protein
MLLCRFNPVIILKLSAKKPRFFLCRNTLLFKPSPLATRKTNQLIYQYKNLNL